MTINTPLQLQEYLTYDCDTGYIHRKYDGRQLLKGNHVGGYKFGMVLGQSIMAHRAAWVIHYGRYPNGYIDHINGVKHDNRIINLRDVTPSNNSRNRVATKGSSSNYLGVCIHTNGKSWMARITSHGKDKYLGLFHSENDAAVAYNNAASEIHGEYARLNVIRKTP